MISAFLGHNVSGMQKQLPIVFSLEWDDASGSGWRFSAPEGYRVIVLADRKCNDHENSGQKTITKETLT